jgi:hypothetical protein
VAETLGHLVVTGEVGFLATHASNILLAARSWGAPYVAWITPLVARAQEIVAGAEHMQAQIRRDRRDGN